MKSIRIYSVLFIVFLLSMMTGSIYAQNSKTIELSNGGVLSNIELLSTGTTIVVLKGNVTVNKEIKVNDGQTLEIRSTKSVTISNGEINGNNYFFDVDGGGKLVINGPETNNENDRYENNIVIDGGSDLNWTGDEFMSKQEPDPEPSVVLAGIIYARSSTLTLKNVTIQNVYDYGSSGGAIYISGTKEMASKAGPTTLENCLIQSCYSQTGPAMHVASQNSSEVDNFHEECKISITDTKVRYCMSGGGTHEKVGGAIRSNGTASSSLYLTNVIMEYNRTFRSTSEDVGYIDENDGNGAALYWNAHGHPEAKCHINGCLFQYNKADDHGGAIMLQGALAFEGAQTIIRNNEAGHGGGMHIVGYAGSADSRDVVNLEVGLNENLIITDNAAIGSNERLGTSTSDDDYVPGNGGGIEFLYDNNMTLEPGSSITVTLAGAQILNNTATGNGGGVYFKNMTHEGNNNKDEQDRWPSSMKNAYDVSVNLNYGTLSQNAANNLGGGIYVLNESVNSTFMQGKSLQVNSNSAKEGGGIYVSGITFEDDKHNTIQKGNLKVSTGTISNNKAKDGSGGGIYLQNGVVNINNGIISQNTSTLYGGGLYVYSQEGGEAEFTGGTVKQNSSLYGGGVCVNGNIKLKIGQIEIADNEAVNGGGICLLGGSSMNFGEGLIRLNKAKKENGTPLNTACKADIMKVYGIGGGVYMGSGTSLTFSVQDKLGLYGNEATYGADDIFANGDNTTVILPDVSQMQLTDFKVPTDNLYWVEDYITNDTSYPNFTEQNVDRLVYRYQYSLKEKQSIYKIEKNHFETVKNGYLCLALGYKNVFAVIKKSGLVTGESAIFNVINMKDNSLYATLLLTGEDNLGSDVQKRIALAEGKWKVVETGWSWNYTATQPEEQKNGKEILEMNSEEKNTFVFINKINEAEKKTYDEAIIPNVMSTSSSSSTDKSK